MNEKFVISVDGGLGDHVSAEPAIRYFKEKVYPHADVRILATIPRVFEHLGIPVYPHNGFDSDALGYKKLFSFPTDAPIHRAVCFLVMHIVDFHSAALMYRALPLADKTVRLGVTEEDRQEFRALLEGRDPKKLTLLHAGKSWRTKTFPKEWWQSVLAELVNGGVSVALIGKEGQLGTGLVPLEPFPGVLDLRNKLSLGGLFAAIAESQVLLSNDSSVVQIAGAFDNWNVMIASCKHPDFVFPYRNGTPQYKSRALYKKLLIDDLPFEPVRDASIHVDVPVPDWTPYLPEPHEVAQEVIGLL